MSPTLSGSDNSEREFLEGLRYEDKFPRCPSCGTHAPLEGGLCGDCNIELLDEAGTL